MGHGDRFTGYLVFSTRKKEPKNFRSWFETNNYIIFNIDWGKDLQIELHTGSATPYKLPRPKLVSKGSKPELKPLKSIRKLVNNGLLKENPIFTSEDPPPDAET